MCWLSVSLGAVIKPPAPSQDSADISVDFAMLDLPDAVDVYDIWQNKALGEFCFVFVFCPMEMYVLPATWVSADGGRETACVPRRHQHFPPRQPACSLAARCHVR
jgi:hypothetical protein